MAARARSVLAAAGVCVALVLTLLLLLAPPPDALRERVRQLASLARSPEDAAERANADAPDPLDAPDDAPDAAAAAFQDDFYGGLPMFGDMMDYWFRENFSRLLKDGERRLGRRELAKSVDLFWEEKDKT